MPCMLPGVTGWCGWSRWCACPAEEMFPLVRDAGAYSLSSTRIE